MVNLNEIKMKKTYLEPKTKLYAMCVEGYLLDHTTVTAGTKDPNEGGDPTAGQPKPVAPNPFNHSSAKEEITWSSED